MFQRSFWQRCQCWATLHVLNMSEKSVFNSFLFHVLLYRITREATIKSAKLFSKKM